MNWYRSLYWRIAAGFIACLALLLVVQGMLFVWMMAKAGSTIPNQPPERFAQTVALDIAGALEGNAALDIEQYVKQEYEKDAQPFVVLLADGRTIELGMRLPETAMSDARARLETLRTMGPGRMGRGGAFGRGGPFRPQGPPSPDEHGFPERGRDFAPPPGLQPPPQDRAGAANGEPGIEGRPPPFDPDGPPGERGPGFGRGGQPFRGPRPAPIILGDRVFGLVIVPAQPPFSFLLIRYAPSLLSVAIATLIVGGVLAAFVVFGPARRRLKGVEDAARRLGAGDLQARAPVTGSDEVTAVASAFNAMANDLSARTDALIEADRSRRQLLADVSHELNTPVTAMRGYLETLSMPELGLDEATRAKYLGIVGDETARLERIIGDLLDLARLEGGGGELRVELVPTSELFERVIARHERTAQAAGVRVIASVGSGAETIAVDRTRLEQALQNLAANALRYAPPRTAVELDAVREGDTVTLLVTDHGPGIPAEHLARVFDRFYKGDASRAAHEGEPTGSGLGLSIVKAIVERHGGKVSVSSVPGRTAFRIASIPTTIAAASDAGTRN
ncbi:MAG: HAMP domain-containing sensor histidine kinase [Vicinamibacterales bacterium]